MNTGNYLNFKKNEKDFYTGTFLEVMNYIKQNR
jgi:hypothetical protein